MKQGELLKNQNPILDQAIRNLIERRAEPVTIDFGEYYGKLTLPKPLAKWVMAAIEKIYGGMCSCLTTSE